MATERDRQDERDRLGNDPVSLPSREELDEENPVGSPADVDNGAGEARDDERVEQAAEAAKTNEDEALESGKELPG